MTIKEQLGKFGLGPNDSIVIGSGILQALGIRKSNDIDEVVERKTFNLLKASKKHKIVSNHSRQIFKEGEFEIGNGWQVLGKLYRFEDFLEESIIVEGVRYITLNFLYRAKKSWVKNDKNPREKDINDIKLIGNYLKNLTN